MKIEGIELTEIEEDALDYVSFTQCNCNTCKSLKVLYSIILKLRDKLNGPKGNI